MGHMCGGTDVALPLNASVMGVVGFTRSRGIRSRMLGTHFIDSGRAVVFITSTLFGANSQQYRGVDPISP